MLPQIRATEEHAQCTAFRLWLIHMTVLHTQTAVLAIQAVM